ncbi:MAG: hypothetical protein ACLUKN_07675 [Bacilli bacterium]
MPQAIMMLVLLVVVTVAIIMILQAVRKVPVQYAKGSSAENSWADKARTCL